MSTGKEYEKFVQSIYSSIITAENNCNLTSTDIQLRKIIEDNCGIKREFDLYWEFKVADVTYKTVVECKDYKNKITAEKIDSFIGKTHDIPGLTLIFVAKNGFQSGAIKKAKHNNISLLEIREQRDEDWQDEDTPLIKTINIKLVAVFPPTIISINPVIDAKWIKDNTNFDLSKPIQFSGLPNEVIIIDNEKNEKYSIFDLEKRLNNDIGVFNDSIEYEDAFIVCERNKFKLTELKYRYRGPVEMPSTIEIDLSEQILGVVNDITKGELKFIPKRKRK